MLQKIIIINYNIDAGKAKITKLTGTETIAKDFEYCDI